MSRAPADAARRAGAARARGAGGRHGTASRRASDRRCGRAAGAAASVQAGQWRGAVPPPDDPDRLAHLAARHRARGQHPDRDAHPQFRAQPGLQLPGTRQFTRPGTGLARPGTGLGRPEPGWPAPEPAGPAADGDPLAAAVLYSQQTISLPQPPAHRPQAGSRDRAPARPAARVPPRWGRRSRRAAPACRRGGR